MITNKDKVISLVYELRLNNSKGEIIESLTEDKPLTFIYGNGSLLQKFEDNISGLRIGESFSFGIKSEDAYGFTTEDAIIDIPKNVFEVEGIFDHDKVKEGNAIPMMDGDGNRLNGIVLEVNHETVKMDFNHPLAGDDLFFSGRITEIRDATSEELTHGHIHQACGCGSGGNDESSGGCCGNC